MGGGEEESQSKHKTRPFLEGDTQGPMAHAVTDRAPCRWVAGRETGRRQADEFSEGTLDILTQQPGLGSPLPPTPIPPSLSLSSLLQEKWTPDEASQHQLGPVN